jgi:hypothetical protein
VKNADRFLEQVLIAINLSKLKQEDELNICDAYRADLNSARVNPLSSHKVTHKYVFTRFKRLKDLSAVALEGEMRIYFWVFLWFFFVFFFCSNVSQR